MSKGGLLPEMIGNLKYLTRLSRRNKVLIQLGSDFLLVFICFFLAMTIRLESLYFLSRQGVLTPVLVTAPVTVFAFRLLGLYRSSVRHVTGRSLIVIGYGALFSAVSLYLFSVLSSAGIPRSVPIIYGLGLFLVVGGLRFAARGMLRQQKNVFRKPAIIYGAGEAGVELLNALFHNRDYTCVAFVDDNAALQGLKISDIRVYAPNRIPEVISRTGAAVVLLALPGISRARRREIIGSLEGFALEIKSTPPLSDVISGKAKLSELRTVTPNELLGRDPVPPNEALMKQNVSGKTVMVSGAGGSIGSELCRQLVTLSPTRLIFFEVSEYALYSIDLEISELAKKIGAAVEVVPILGSVQNERRLEEAIKSFGVQTIFHAAAYKHVPLVEDNVIEAVRNNVFGTLAISAAAQELNVENFVLISTDKAVRPTNVMGATKRIAELICKARSRNSASTVFSMVRFGNVLGSSGSVIPRFREQIEQGGPITVTHPEVTRYFMTISEASQLVIQAGAMSKGGDVFVLDMGEPVRILDLAIGMVKLHGLVPYIAERASEVGPEHGDIPICIMGLRKGEKLYEELLIGNDPKPTAHPRIMSASEVSLDCTELRPALDQLMAACDDFDVARVIEILMTLPLEYTPANQDDNEASRQDKDRPEAALAEYR